MEMRRVVFALALFAAASALKLDSNSDAVAEEQEWKERPVAKVLKMLKDMAATLQNEADNDQELYDKLVCWCETNDKEKTKAIADANQQIKDLTAAIEEYSSKDKQLTTDIATLGSEMAKNKKALDEAAAVRAKELAEFNQDEKDMIASIGSLKSAVVTLEKQHPGASALQQEALLQVTKVLRQKPEIVASVAPHNRHRLKEFLSHPEGMIALLQQPVAAQSYNPASGEIFGMLKQMKETFETNMETAKKDEAESVKNYGEMKTAKESELKADGEKEFQKKADLGTTKENTARAKEDLENTEEALEADTEFLADLKAKCATMDADWAARSKMRSEEMVAVSETISILDSDEAHDQFSKSLGLIQMRAEAMKTSAARARAAAFLAEAAKKFKNPRVSYLAVRMRFDPFGKMRENLDGMVHGLEKEKKDEVVHKDECVTDLNTNEKDTTAKTTTKDELETEIAALETDIAGLTDEERRLMQEIADAQVAMKGASENREKENKDFQEVIADQRATQAILQKAVAKLGEFYNKKAALLQVKSRKAPGEPSSPMPEGFGEYKKGGGGGAMAMIQQIIDDSKATEQDAITSETDAQSAYEAFVKDTNKAIKTKQEAIVADDENIAEDKVVETHDETDKRETVGDILALGEMNGSIHQACDFTLDHFEERQANRDKEAEALKQAKEIFSGAGFGR